MAEGEMLRSTNTFAALLARETPDMGAIADHLNGLGNAARTREAIGLGRRDQSKLFAAAEGVHAIDPGFLVPNDAAPLSEVVHEGHNTMPAFRRFAKVFCRGPEDAAPPEERWGYNRQRQTPIVETVVGPGYFVAGPHSVPGELLVDYLRVPPGKPAAWPPILPNSARLSRFVYQGTQDVLRGVSDHMSIGRAMKNGRWLPAWFILVRQD
ncbi:MAG: hypothetical protein CMN30_28445 [Sandaracinus sp.]|nr:hypothetical protein [Sandaracinus sp.]